MEILRTIALYVEGKGMPFVVIGGHAVNCYGISRQTGDLDLLVRRSDKMSWLNLMQKLRYIKGQDDERFAKFRPDSLAAWPIDLMFIEEQSFQKMSAEAVDVTIGAAQVRVVSARHLVALKLHALKHFQEHRFAKDYGDVLSLLKYGKAEISESDLRDLCGRYASAELFERLKNDLKRKE